MSSIASSEGVVTVRPDYITNTYRVFIPDAVTEEVDPVKNHLKAGIAARTREFVDYIHCVACEIGAELMVKFRTTLTQVFMDDIVNALTSFFADQGIACAVV